MQISSLCLCRHFLATRIQTSRIFSRIEKRVAKPYSSFPPCTTAPVADIAQCYLTPIAPGVVTATDPSVLKRTSRHRPFLHTLHMEQRPLRLRPPLLILIDALRTFPLTHHTDLIQPDPRVLEPRGQRIPAPQLLSLRPDAQAGTAAEQHRGGEVRAVGCAVGEEDDEADEGGEEGEEDGQAVGEPEFGGGVGVDLAVGGWSLVRSECGMRGGEVRSRLWNMMCAAECREEADSHCGNRGMSRLSPEAQRAI